MAILFDKQGDGAVKLTYHGGGVTFFKNLSNVEVKKVQMTDGAGGTIPSILISWDAGYKIFSYAELGNINGSAKPGNIDSTISLLSSSVFNFAGEGQAVSSETRSSIISKLNSNGTEKISLSALEDAVLSEDQFEVLESGKIGIKLSYLQSLGLGSGTAPANTTPAAPTVTGNDSTNTLVASHALGTSEIVMSENNGSYIPYAPISVGDVARAAGYWKFKVKSATGRNESAVVNSPAFSVASGAPYTVDKTIMVNFSSSFQSVPNESVAPFWNYLRSTSAAVAAANGVTANSLVDKNNSATSINLKNSSPFSVTVGEILAEQTTAGDTGVYKNAIVNTAWTLNTGTNAAITLENLDPTKFYQLYFLMPTKIGANTVRKVTINGVSKTKTSSSLLASFGVAGNGLNDGEWIVFNNIQGSTITATFGKDSGDYTVYLAAMAIEESSTAKV